MVSAEFTPSYPRVFLTSLDDCPQMRAYSQAEIVEVWRDSIGKKPKITITSTEIQYAHCHGRQVAGSALSRILECMLCSWRSLQKNSPYSKEMNVSMANILRRDLSLIEPFQQQLGVREQEMIRNVKDGLRKFEQVCSSSQTVLPMAPNYREIECVVREVVLNEASEKETLPSEPPQVSTSSEDSDPIVLSPENAQEATKSVLVKNYTKKYVKKSYARLQNEIQQLERAQCLSNIRGSEDFLQKASIQLEVAKEVLRDKEVEAEKKLLDSKRKRNDQQKIDQPEKQAKKRRSRSQSLGSEKLIGKTRAEAVAEHVRQVSLGLNKPAEKTGDARDESLPEPVSVATTAQRGNKGHLDFILNPS